MLQQPNPLPLVDAGGRPLRLGAELGRGGEGSVFALADRADLVAKLYHHRPGAEKSAKSSPWRRGQRPAAEAGRAGRPARSTRPRAAARAGLPDAEDLRPQAGVQPLQPEDAAQEFPTAGLGFLLHAAANAARAFAVIHDSGHVIGDVNHGNSGRGRRRDREAHRLRQLPGPTAGRSLPTAMSACRPMSRRNSRALASSADPRTREPRQFRPGRPRLPAPVHGPPSVLRALSGRRRHADRARDQGAIASPTAPTRSRCR